jgi:peptidoglycan hydrolase-like protein with peptidoglycan-binding domain
MQYSHIVEHLQRTLNLLGHDAGTVDGLRGAGTNAGIQDYIAEHDIPGDSSAIPADTVLRHAVKDLLGQKLDSLDSNQIKALESGLHGLDYKYTTHASGHIPPELREAAQKFREHHPDIAQNSPASASPNKVSFNQAASGQDPLSAGIQKYAESAVESDMKYDYESGFNAPADSSALNCSGFVYHAVRSGLKTAETAQDYRTIDSTAQIVQTYGANQVKQVGDAYGTLIRDPEQLSPGMIIGLDTGEEVADWRYANIDHVAVAYRADNGQIMVAESNQYYGGARITPADDWLAQHKGDEIFAADISNAVRPKRDMDEPQIVRKQENDVETKPETASLDG